MEGRRKLECLDGLRGVAVLLVVLFHHRLMGEGRAERTAFEALLAPSRFGYSGVHLFLVLSGFCLTHSLVRRARSGRAPGYRRYLADRWRRIAPPYYAALGLGAIAAWLAGALGQPVRPDRAVTARQVLIHAGFLHGFWADTLNAINPAFWSLALEFQFYLVLPLLFAMAGRLGWAPVVAGVALLSLAWRSLIYGVMPERLYLVNGVFLGRWTEFAAGMAIALWFNRANRSRAGWGVVGGWALGAGTFLAVALAMALRQRHFLLDFAFGAGYAALLVAALLSAERRGWLDRLLSGRWLVAIGAISYSVYLTHMLLLEAVGPLYRRLVPRPSSATEAGFLLASLAGVLGVGLVFFGLVERRFPRSVAAPEPGPRYPQPRAARLHNGAHGRGSAPADRGLDPRVGLSLSARPE